MTEDATPQSGALGIVPPGNRKTVGECLRRGWYYVNLPVFILIVAGYGTPLLITRIVTGGNRISNPFPQSDPGLFAGLMAGITVFMMIVVLPVLPAWLWWSYAVPKWRIWALRNVHNWPKLEKAAIADKLIWPPSSIFNLTEIKTSAQKTLEDELIAHRRKHG